MTGDPWTPQEEERLVEAFDAGADLWKLAHAHDRTPAAIATRLVALRRLAVIGSAYYVAKPEPWVTFRGVSEMNKAFKE